MSTLQRSTPVEEFERLYQSNKDPWSYTWLRAFRTAFSGRLYERRKYWKTLRAIPRGPYRNALEIGCSIGVFTKALARRCQKLLAIDYSPTALAYARQRCRKSHQVRFAEAKVPDDFPNESFDLIIFSEVAYYLAKEDFVATAQQILARLEPGGCFVMVHYRHHKGLPLSGDFAHDWFAAQAGSSLTHVVDGRSSAYRLDVFRNHTSGQA